MAAYNKYDPRLESLVVETKTLWGDDVGDLSDDDRTWLAHAIHENPHLAGQIQYERAHTGFTRIITVTADDVARLYEEKFGAAAQS
ncbi:hypothetical protein [Maioricimonas sp. JC845]|uniref:hypothetical protein n=1 Tax=Maioricimonas sp. JC845 TaxID=3232138 RepID=UPI003457B85D